MEWPHAIVRYHRQYNPSTVALPNHLLFPDSVLNDIPVATSHHNQLQPAMATRLMAQTSAADDTTLFVTWRFFVAFIATSVSFETTTKVAFTLPLSASLVVLIQRPYLFYLGSHISRTT